VTIPTTCSPRTDLRLITWNPNELALYERVYEHLGPRVLKPDLVIYLQARPGRAAGAASESAGASSSARFDADYLSELSRTYNDFFHRWDETPLLVINTSDIDFAESEQDLDDLNPAPSLAARPARSTISP